MTKRKPDSLRRLWLRLEQWQRVLRTGLPFHLVPLAQPTIIALENKIRSLLTKDKEAGAKS